MTYGVSITNSYSFLARETQVPSVKIKYVLPAAAIPHPREHSPMKQSPKTREKGTINVPEKIPIHVSPRRSTPPPADSTRAPPDHGTAAATGMGEEVSAGSIDAAPISTEEPAEDVQSPGPRMTEITADNFETEHNNANERGTVVFKKPYVISRNLILFVCCQIFSLGNLKTRSTNSYPGKRNCKAAG